ncbi:pyridoxal phosphate-dependent transferase [Mycotypha africana]|uniref:pyridoxal phosphate-dependent transferase n=1 Tax=Mycotypha africana TaxID=64632 RepID=UPI00230119E6|nr:pyridoxal phosphate-dependent transferase [Mycotypha africana]KAI8967026.1 pyridoxal phosphate-dependent transferase [Mycotypha africana]
MVAIDSINNAGELDIMLSRMQEMVTNYIREGEHRIRPVVNFRNPNELYKVVDFSLPDAGSGADGTFDLIKSTLEYSVNSWNPRFMDKLYAGANPIGVISELLLAVLNSNTHVYHCSPVFTLMEIEVTKAMGRLFNLGTNAGGLFCPGGSASNLLAIVTARNTLYPSIKKEGYLPRPFNPTADYGKLKIFTSSHSHYSIDKGAQLMGLGADNIVKVPVDNNGRMRVDELERLMCGSIEKGETPFFINATAGTTVLGAFDPIRRISAVAKKYNCWLHVDASWGGGAIFSNRTRSSGIEASWFDGSELADTITFNPHKLLGVPLQCSMLLTPHNGHLLYAQANSLQADYLFHGNPYDLGAGTIGCGRRPDAAKLFLSWKFYGKEGFGARIDRALDIAQQFTDIIRCRPNFRLVKNSTSFLQVCFWFVPPRIASFIEKDGSLLANVTKELHKKVNQRGDFMIDHAPVEGIPDFFRIVINAPTVDLHDDLEKLLEAIEEADSSIEEWNEILQ